MKSIAEIKEEFLKSENTEEIIEKYRNDERKGVQALVISEMKKTEKRRAELERLDKMAEYEEKYYAEGIEYIAGVDEVGRGPLAGPVVTSAVILPVGCRIVGINDSKKLSDKKRRELAEEIKEKAVAYNIGMESNGIIDEINILQATLRAMKSAVEGLKVKPQQVLIDAVKIPDIDIPQEAIIKGDAKSMSIAAASIIAKVTRDDIMIKMAELYPEYNFKSNVGYGSAEHIDAIKKYGLCPIHRRSFTKNFIKEKE